MTTSGTTQPEKIGKYRIRKPLPASAAFTWLEASDPDLDMKVRIRQPNGRDAELHERFRAEGRLLADIDHPNVLPILDADEDAAGKPFQVLPHLGDRFPARPGPLPDSVNLIAQVTAGVGQFHRRGVTYGCLFPTGLGITQTSDGPVVKLDVPVHAWLGERHPLVEVAGRARAFLAPETAPGDEPGQPVNDVFGIGVLAYGLLTGSLPSSGGRRPQERRPEIGDELDRWIVQSLAADPKNRFPDAAAQLGALRSIVMPPSRDGSVSEEVA